MQNDLIAPIHTHTHLQSSAHKDSSIGVILSRLVNINLVLYLESVIWKSSTLLPIRPAQTHVPPLKGDKWISEDPLINDPPSREIKIAIFQSGNDFVREHLHLHLIPLQLHE